MSINNMDTKSKRVRGNEKREKRSLIGDEVRELVTICESAEKNRQKK